MSGFIEWLEDLNKKNTKVRAVLRRSLAFDPGTYVSAYPYVESFVKDENNTWRRDIHYLVAGLWAAHWREGRHREPMLFGKACQKLYCEKEKSPSIERRFITLLDSDHGQLPHRLRQMLALLKEYPIDFGALLTSLLYWNDNLKRTQTAWAREFYRNTQEEMEKKPTTQEEQAV